MKRIALAIALTLTLLGVRAQTGADTIISFVNCYSGGVIYELEGHSAIRIRMNGQDLAVNFGLFDFEEPGFVYRFVSGATNYRVGAMPWSYFYDYYVQQNRRVVEHELDLTPEQRSRLIDYLAWHTRPENCTYRYNYVKDNCSTRPLRFVELALGDSLHLGAPALPEADARTFRSVMRHYHRNYPWYQFGIDLALGPGIDFPLDRRQTSFAPTVLDSQLPGATVGGRPLVAHTRVLWDADPESAVEPPTPWLLTPMAAALLLLLLIGTACAVDIRRGRTTRWVDAAFYGLYGLLGLVLAFLIFISTHEATSPNFNFLWLNPFCLIPVIFIWWRSGRRVVLYYQVVNLAVLLVGCAAWPWIPQSANPAFLPMVVADMLRSATFIYLNRKNP